MGAFLESLGEIPLAPLPVAAALLAVAAQLVLLRLALGQRRRELAARDAAAAGRWSELGALDSKRTKRWQIAAVVAPVLLVATAALSTGRARGLVAQAALAEDPSEKVTLISRSIGGQLNALAFGAASLILVSSLAVVALSIAVATRLRLDGLRRAAELAARGQAREAAAWVELPGPRPALVYASAALLHGMGLLPLLAGALQYCTTLIQSLAAMAGQPPELKMIAFDRALVVARIVLESSYHASLLGLAIAVVAVGLLWSIRRTHPGLVAPRSMPALAAGAVAVAAVLYAGARPLRAENAVPWPPMDPVGEVVVARIATPRLRGPDPIHRAPVLTVTLEATQLDGRDASLEDLAAWLGTLKTNYRMLNPGEPFDELVVVCSSDTPALHLRARLHEALLVGFDHPVFAFIERRHVHRPMFGDIERVTNTGARIATVDWDDDGLGLHGSAEPTDGALRLELSDFRTCADLSARIVDERKRGREIEIGVHVPVSGARQP